MDILNTDGHRGGYGNILLPRDLSLPLDLRALSGGRGQTELEVGFGNGEYTVRHAGANPDTFLLGMEVSPACVLRCARRSGGLDNLRLIRTDARYMMKELFADASLDKIYMNFPCPWLKKRKDIEKSSRYFQYTPINPMEIKAIRIRIALIYGLPAFLGITTVCRTRLFQLPNISPVPNRLR